MLTRTVKTRLCVLCTHIPSRAYVTPARKTRKPTGKSTKKQLESKLGLDAATSGGNIKSTGESLKSRVESFLDELDASPKIPSMQDFHNIKPMLPLSPDPEDPQYTKAYDATITTVIRSFNRPQMIEFAGLLQLEGKLPLRQRDLASALIEKAWGWTNPRTEKAKRKDMKKQKTLLIPVEPAFMFLLMGKDGSDLFELGHKFQLKIAIVTSSAMSLQVEGSSKSIASFEEHIKFQEKQLISKSIKLGNQSFFDPSVLQRISKLSGAFVEVEPKSTNLRVTAFDQPPIHDAERLIMRAINETGLQQHNPLLSHYSSPPDDSFELPATYSFYPFHPSKGIPWIVGSKSMFRMRQVLQWLVEDDQANFQSEGSLGQFRLSDGSLVDARAHLQAKLSSSKYEATRSWSASIGHILFTNKESQQDSQFSPPLAGDWEFSEFLTWLQKSEVPSWFIPSLPSTFIRSQPSSSVTIHRLIYRKFHRRTSNIEKSAAPGPSQIFLVDVVMNHHPWSENIDAADSNSESITLDPLNSTRCRVGLETFVDILLPERPMDIRLSARDLSNIQEEDEPVVIQNYLEGLLKYLNFTADTQPSPPDEISYDKVRYSLYASYSVRRSEEHQPVFRSGASVFTESSLDLQTKERATSCMVESFDCDSKNGWKDFIGTCDDLTAVGYTLTGDPLPRFSER